MRISEHEDRYLRHLDANSLRYAAGIIRRRTTWPKSFWVRVIVRVLERNADRLESGEHG